MSSFKKYKKAFELGLQTALEYRLNFLLSLIAAIYPIFIQTFLWTAIYNASNSSAMYGYSYQQIIIYTFLAGLVARMIYTGFEYDIMEDIQTGKFSKFLVQPLDYFSYRLSSFLGRKMPELIMLLFLLAIVLASLSVLWNISLEGWRILLFLVTIVLSLILNFLLFYCFSVVSFWLVKIGFMFEGIRILAILLSGGIFPLEVFGDRFIQITNVLPFKYTISYPINILNGKLLLSESIIGIFIQCLWIIIILISANFLWKTGSRRYVAVGG
jgi:ABC-2 type transport system permease protein